ncbi:MAG: Ig-like domain-containing protein [Gemmatimonadales bacterium]|nr:Ig-like domain-containing protein [Gemmatimonadales bacterium]
MLPGDAGPAGIAVASGDGQRGEAGTPLRDSIVVRVTDAQGRGVPSMPIVFGLNTALSGGDLVPDTSLTNDEGLAGVRWVLGAEVGQQSVDASVVGQSLSVRFNAIARAPSATAITPESGDAQSAAAGTALAQPLVVRVTDDSGNPVGGVTVRWEASSGSVSPAETTTDSDGRAAAVRMLGTSVGEQTARASSGVLAGSPVTFTHTAVPGTAASLVLISGNDQSAAPGAELAEPLRVRLVDVDGNGIAGRAVSWVAASGGSAAPESSDTDSDGYAITRWTLGPSAGSNTLSAVVSGVGIVEFTAIAVADGPGLADHLVFVIQPPESVEKGRRIAPPVTVAIVDRDGIPVANSGIEIRLSTTPGRDRLRQNQSERTVNGIAIFDDLEIKEEGTYRLIAEARGGVELGVAESRTFEVRGGREDDD